MSSIAVTASASGAGVISLQAPITATNRTITLPDSTGTVATAESTLAQFNATGAAPVYACRAWVNFNGTGTVAIRASGNVSSITDNGVGDYTVNFTTAMPDANYSPEFSTSGTNTTDTTRVCVLYGSDASGATVKTTSAFRFLRGGTTSTNGMTDGAEINVAVFR